MPSERDGAGRAGQAEPLLAFADGLLSSARATQATSPTETRQYVTFFLRDDEYAIPILQCREIVRLSAVTRVPEAPAHVRGVVNLRGRLVPAIDTRMCLALEPASPTPRSRLIVIEAAGRLFALIVDRVARTLKLATSSIEPATEALARQGATGVVRLDDAIIRLLDAEQVLHLGPAVAQANPRSEDA